MGLPEINIEFKAKAETAVIRSSNGIAALILYDDTKSGAGNESYSYGTEAEINKEDWTTTNQGYLNLAFMGSPKRVIVERKGTEDEIDDILSRLKNKHWNYLAIPGIGTESEDVSEVGKWIIAQRAAKKTFKAVLPCSSASYSPNNMGIIDFATENNKAGLKTYTAAEYCARIAGLLAGLSLSESATYAVLPELESISESLTPDEDIDAGKMILINDGEKIKIACENNSLTTLSGDLTEDMKSIKIVEGMDLIRDDIRTTFEENYIGENNSYDNKMLFVGAVNQYFDELVRNGVLYDQYDNTADIDIDGTRSYLISKGYDVSEMSETEIKQANTGKNIYVSADVQFSDAISNLYFGINMN